MGKRERQGAPSGSGVAVVERRAGSTAEAGRPAAWTWRSAYALGLVGALGFAVAAWLPWFVVTGQSYTDQYGPAQSRFIDPGFLNAPPLDALFGKNGAFFVWSALTILGLLLLPLLRRRPNSLARQLSWAGYGIWLCTATVLLVSLAMFPSQVRDEAPLLLSHTAPALDGFYAQSALFSTGFWLAVASLLLCWLLVGAQFLWGARSVWREHAAPPVATSSKRLRRTLPGVSALTAGLVLWLVGTVALPWMTVSCTAFPLLFGTCTGLPFSGVLAYAIHDQAPLVDTLVALNALGALFAGGALLLLAGAWRRAISPQMLAWATIWLIAATGCFALASLGVRIVTTQAGQLGLVSGAWSGDSGIYVSLLGLLLGWGGTLILWVVARRGSRA